MALLLVDLIVAVTVLEAAFLVLRHRLTGRGWPASRVIPNLAAGLCLLLGLRVALTGGNALWIAACLAGSGVAHAFDLRGR